MSTFDIADARLLDAGAVADILSAAQDQQPWLPRLYTRAQDLHHSDQMIRAGWVSVARKDTEIIGFSAVKSGFVHSLYVHPQAQGGGVGKTLIDHLKKRCKILTLHSYQRSKRANHFYQRNGFVELRRSDGRDNDVKLPDIVFQWRADVLG
ncbi:MAG: GNAT family N-acetyltransferase [Pseudomonadota bacterium]